MPKTILITGCSEGGIGGTLALRLADAGHRVFATARSVGKLSPALREHDNVTALPLDVTVDSSVESAAAAVKAMGCTGLDILVNNAGAGYAMPMLDVDISRAKHCMDINLWGTLRTVQAFSDMLIASRGRVVNLSSCAAPLYTPWIGRFLPKAGEEKKSESLFANQGSTGTYTASKIGVTAISETLRLELAPLGVSVACIMVGTVGTKFHDNEDALVLPSTSLYQSIYDTINKWARGEAGPARGSVEQFADTIMPDVLGTKTGKIWRGPNSGAVWFAATWLPTYVVVSLS